MKSSLWQTLAAAAFAAAAFAVAGATATPAEAKQSAKKPTAAKRAVAPQGGADRTAGEAPDLRVTDRSVREGVIDGSLTPAEVKRLNELMERVEIMKRMVRNDDVVSGWERYQMKDVRAQMRRRILRERLDEQLRINPRYLALRLEKGLNEGTITQREAETLRASQRRIKKFATEAMRDGVLSRRERALMLRAQRRLAVELSHARRYGPYRQALGSSDFKDVLKRGLAQGRITRSEALGFRYADRRFRAMMKNASADGRITRRERQKLLKARSDVSRAYPRARYAGAGLRTLAGGSRGNEARNFSNAARNFNRSVGSGMSQMGRLFGGR